MQERLKRTVKAPLPTRTELPRPSSPIELHRQLSFEYSTRLPHWVLSISDRLGMAECVELRVPFLDQNTIDMVGHFHASLMLRRNTEKYALKQTVADVLQRTTTKRRKKPFITPIAPWYIASLDTGRSVLVQRYSTAEAVERIGIFDPAEVEKLVVAACANDGSREAASAECACLSVLATQIVVDQHVHQRTFEQSRGQYKNKVVRTPKEQELDLAGAAAAQERR